MPKAVKHSRSSRPFALRAAVLTTVFAMGAIGCSVSASVALAGYPRGRGAVIDAVVRT